MQNSILAKLLLTLSLSIPMLVSADNKGFVDLELSTGSNNNVFLESDNILLNEIEAISADDTQNQYFIGMGYKFLDLENSDIKILLDVFKEELVKNKIGTTSRSLALPYTYYSTHYRFRIKPSATDYQIDGDSVLSYTGTYIDLTRKLGDHRLGLEISSLQSIARTANYSAYQGNRQDIHLHFTPSTLYNKVNIKIGQFSHHYNAVGSIDNSYDGKYISASMSLRKSSFELGLYGKLQSRHYSQFYARNFNRKDNHAAFSIKPQFNIKDIANLFIDFELLKNSSNLNDEIENQNYQQRVITVGVNWFW